MANQIESKERESGREECFEVKNNSTDYDH